MCYYSLLLSCNKLPWWKTPSHDQYTKYSLSVYIQAYAADLVSNSKHFHLMELHIACPIAGAPSLDPACLASAWLCQLSPYDVSIIPSGNQHLSPNYTLPVLLPSDSDSSGSLPITGLPEIATKLLDRSLEPKEVALLAYFQQLSVITKWTLFVIPENYEGLTRPEVSAVIPFPMQYTAVLALQREAQASQPQTQKYISKPPPTNAVNKLHEDMLKQNATRWKAKETPKQNIARMTQFQEIIRDTREMLATVPELSPAKLLLMANLVLLTLDRLPVRPLSSLVDQDEELRKLRSTGIALNYQLTSLAPVPSDKAYTLWNTIKSYRDSFR